MKKLLLLFILQNFATAIAQGQTITVDELIKLANMPIKDIDPYMHKKGFLVTQSNSDSGFITASFSRKARFGKKNIDPTTSVDIQVKSDSKYFTLHLRDLNEYLAGKLKLIKSGFFYDTLKDVKKERSLLFQKANISIQANTEIQDSIAYYSFNLKENAIPSSLGYAEDLLQFDSHQFLASYFGEQNVKKDLYYLTEKELKKCSVLFNGTPRQVLFVWDDEVYLNHLSYIIVTDVLPTAGGKDNNPLSQHNEWQLKNGIYAGMPLKDLLKINEMDFDIYGNRSELAFLAKPNKFGKINFDKTAIMFSCHGCYDNKIFNQQLVSALDIAKANLPVKVFDVVLYASQ